MPGYYDYSLKFFDRFYRPENVTLVMVGDVQPQQAVEMTRKYYGDWKKGYKAPEVPVEPPQTERKTGHIDWPNPIRPHVALAYHIPAFSATSSDSAALDLIEQLLFAESAPLFQELVVKNQWVDFISGSPTLSRDPSLFMVFSRVKSEDLIPKVKETVDRYVKQLQSEPVDPKRLDRIKSHMRYGFALGLSTPGSVANQTASAIAVAGDVDAINQRFAQYQKVTPADIQRVARETFKTQNETMVTLSHKAAKAAPAAQGAQGGANHD
jgi:zinc protease